MKQNKNAMPKFEWFIVSFVIFQLIDASNSGDASDSSNVNYVVVALDEWDMNNSTELRQILLSLRHMNEGRDKQNSVLKNDDHSENNFYEDVIVVLDGSDDILDERQPLTRNMTFRGTSRDEVRGIIWNPRRRRERRRRHQAAYSQVMNLEDCWEKHDSCESLNTNEIKLRLKNEEEQRFWHCNCELEFYHCLHRMNTTLSNRIGELYFDHNYRCYRLDHEVRQCRQYDTHRGGPVKRCVQYLMYLNSDMKNQWFDTPFYSGEPMQTPLFTIKKT